MADKNKLSTPQKEDLKDAGADRAREGKSDGVTFLQGILSSDEKNEIREESFEHTKEMIRDAETKKQVEDNDEDENKK